MENRDINRWLKSFRCFKIFQCLIDCPIISARMNVDGTWSDSHCFFDAFFKWIDVIFHWIRRNWISASVNLSDMLPTRLAICFNVLVPINLFRWWELHSNLQPFIAFLYQPLELLLPIFGYVSLEDIPSCTQDTSSHWYFCYNF